MAVEKKHTSNFSL